MLQILNLFNQTNVILNLFIFKKIFSFIRAFSKKDIFILNFCYYTRKCNYAIYLKIISIDK